MKSPLKTYREWRKRCFIKKKLDKMIVDSDKPLRPDLVPRIVMKTDCRN